MLRPVSQGTRSLRPLQRADAPALHALIDENRPHLRPWLAWLDEQVTLEDTRAWTEDVCRRHANREGLEAGIWQGAHLVGAIGLHELSWGNRRAAIGYWLGARYQGQGNMAWACRALIDAAFDELGLNRLEIRCATENRRSRAVPERLGFVQEGMLRQAEWLCGRFVDHAVYGLLAAEWRERP